MPFGILLFYQCNFPRTRPLLEVLLALQRIADRVVLLEVNQPRYLMLLREPFDYLFAMLVYTSHEIVCHADIQRSIPLTGEDVHITAHERSVGTVERRVKPGDDGFGDWEIGRTAMNLPLSHR